MASRQTLFRIFYAIGFTPWDGHPQSAALRKLVEEGEAAPGSALDLGCGTGDSSIYLARHGWEVTAVDFTPKALQKARTKARNAEVNVNFVHADVTRLTRAGLKTGFGLIVDNGCLHNMSDTDRDAYVREVSALAAPQARLFIVAFVPGGRIGVRGVTPAEMERRFARGWTLLSSGDERESNGAGKWPARHYLFQRQT